MTILQMRKLWYRVYTFSKWQSSHLTANREAPNTTCMYCFQRKIKTLFFHIKGVCCSHL